MKSWAGYASLAAAIAVVGGVIATMMATPEAARGIRFAALVAWAVQAGAFAFMLWVREHPTLFLTAWAAGIVLRFAVVGLLGFWLTRTRYYPPAPALVGLVAFMFVMVLLEALFLGKGQPSA